MKGKGKEKEGEGGAHQVLIEGIDEALDGIAVNENDYKGGEDQGTNPHDNRKVADHSDEEVKGDDCAICMMELEEEEEEEEEE